MTANITKRGFHVKKSILIANDFASFFLRYASSNKKVESKTIQPNKNKGNNSPPAGKSRLLTPKIIAKHIKDMDVIIVESLRGRIICTCFYPFKKRRPI